MYTAAAYAEPKISSCDLVRTTGEGKRERTRKGRTDHVGLYTHFVEFALVVFTGLGGIVRDEDNALV